MIAATFEPLGDEALLIRLGERIDVDLNAATTVLADRLRAANVEGIVDIAPAYASICVRYKPEDFFGPHAAPPFERIAERLRHIVENAATADGTVSSDTSTIEIPVCYGGEFGPDLAFVAEYAGLSADAAIAAHVSGDYRVAMLGFAPGFPYLLGLNAALHAPRRATPRTRVPAGSVAIGGAQTGIYPHELPGGWQIIGRTPTALFDARRSVPALLSPGMRVRFRAVDAAHFDAASP